MTGARLDVEILVGSASESGVESILALVVASANGVLQVESVDNIDTSWILASSWHCGLTLSCDKVEVLVGSA